MKEKQDVAIIVLMFPRIHMRLRLRKTDDIRDLGAISATPDAVESC
jgi:hypothetical protein